MIWVNIIKDLQKKFEDNNAASKVICGALAPEDFTMSENTVIFLIRYKEYDNCIKNMHNNNTATCYLYIENWVREDSPNPLQGYIKLAAQEKKVINSLKEYVTEDHENYCILSCDIQEIIGDSDSKRPVLGSRITLKIEYSETA